MTKLAQDFEAFDSMLVRARDGTESMLGRAHHLEPWVQIPFPAALSGIIGKMFIAKERCGIWKDRRKQNSIWYLCEPGELLLCLDSGWSGITFIRSTGAKIQIPFTERTSEWSTTRIPCIHLSEPNHSGTYGILGDWAGRELGAFLELSE